MICPLVPIDQGEIYPFLSVTELMKTFSDVNDIVTALDYYVMKVLRSFDINMTTGSSFHYFRLMTFQLIHSTSSCRIYI